MKRTTTIVLSIFVLLSATVAVVAEPLRLVTFPGNVPRAVAVRGTVTALVGGIRQPIKGASVELYIPSADAAHRVVASVVTSSDGSYRITNPAPVAGEATLPDVPSGTYELHASYRKNNANVGSVVVNVTMTVTRDIDLGAVVRAGGAAPPSPAVTFYATDRQISVGAASIQSMFMNGRIVDPCLPSPACLASYGMVQPIGPIYGTPVPATSVSDLVASINARFPAATGIIVFVHGYNNDFFSAFQLGSTWVSALDPTQPVIVYSWPSNHQTLKYLDDETNNTWALDHFRDFLIDLLNTPNAPRLVNLISHSMGNRLTVSALDYLARSGVQTTGHIGQAVFAAPDVDSGTFFEAVPKMATVAQGLTLYGSTHDDALRSSRQLHGHCRAGLVNCDYAVPAVANFNAVDASIFHCDFLGHGYWASSSTMRADIADVLRNGVNVSGRMRPHLQPGAVPNSYLFFEVPADDDSCGGEATGP